MGIFAKKPVQSVKQAAPQVLMLPLSAHEVGELIEVITAVRGGERMAAEMALQSIQRWEARRSIVALGTLGERYIKYLVDVAALVVGEGPDGVKALVEKLRTAIPETLRPSEEVMFDAVVLATSSNNLNVRRRIEEDPAGALVGLVYLCAACTSLSNEVPSGKRPSLGEMLHGIAAPW